MDPPPQDGVRPPSVFHSVPGYEKMLTEGEGGFLGFLHPPMLSDQHPQPEIQPSCPNWDIPSLSKDDAQQAFIKYASNKRCYSTKPAEEGVITNMEAFDTYRYRLETFTETRTTEWSQRPYYGEKMDTSGQTPPSPWEIPVHAPFFFQDGKQIIEIPHTSSVKKCISCSARGRITCTTCFGDGTKTCNGCGGIGYNYYYQNRQLCFCCSGRGRINCWQCCGLGKVECDVCSGKQNVIVSINLVVIWLNDVEEHLVEQSSGLQMFKLYNVPGKELFTDSNYMVHPVTNFPDPSVAEASERLLREHQAKYLQTSRILQQRQTVDLVPITKVTYEWKGESHVFFVYGSDLRVSAEGYPAACCCCTVM
ncbi:protein SSUH2 homolog [Siniperca chuatsi]|uniref:protein SSUH2 homolog n=1 Tax=Siniperca chuatsi TaxID=119488 RepID=UPI001CE22A75|nr:protein SSUH2 homolog [Siniperca chuatsi]